MQTEQFLNQLNAILALTSLLLFLYFFISKKLYRNRQNQQGEIMERLWELEQKSRNIEIDVRIIKKIAKHYKPKAKQGKRN